MKDLSVALLLDAYGALLNDKQYRILKDYYYDDLSLSEIAENEGITRQGAHETIKRSEQLLNFYEEKLHILDTSSRLKSAAKVKDFDTILDIIDKI